MQEQKASRNIPLADLYSCLQLEYISYFLRSKIYSKEFTESYKSICEAKKDKIDKIASKNGLPSIFNDVHYRDRYIKKFLNKSGVPNFTYKDDVIKKKMSCWDAHYFFQKGTSVKFDVNDETFVGNVIANDKTSSVARILGEDSVERDLHYLNIARIFSEDYFQF